MLQPPKIICVPARFFQPLELVVVYSVFYAAVFVCGLVGNVFCILAVAMIPTLRSTTDYMISSLALADLLIIVFCLPTTLLNNLLTGLFGRRRALCAFCANKRRDLFFGSVRVARRPASGERRALLILSAECRRSRAFCVASRAALRTSVVMLPPSDRMRVVTAFCDAPLALLVNKNSSKLAARDAITSGAVSENCRARAPLAKKRPTLLAACTFATMRVVCSARAQSKGESTRN